MSEKKEKQNVMNPVPWLVVLSLLIMLIPLYYLNQKEDIPSGYEVATTEVEEAEPVPTPVMKTEITSKEVESVLKQVSELITSKYYYTNAADFDSVLTWFDSDWVNPFTKSSGYIIYDGIVSIGIDLNKVEYEIDNDNQIVTIKLPKERDLAHEIDDSSVKTNSKEAVFNNLDAKYYAELIDKLKKETETKIMNNKEYLEQVRSNTKIVIQDFFKNEEKMADYEILITSKN
jgi:septum formation inhibitor MinC